MREKKREEEDAIRPLMSRTLSNLRREGQKGPYCFHGGVEERRDVVKSQLNKGEHNPFISEKKQNPVVCAQEKKRALPGGEGKTQEGHFITVWDGRRKKGCPSLCRKKKIPVSTFSGKRERKER